MNMWVKTLHATDPEFPGVARVVFACAQAATAALSRRMPARLIDEGWPLTAEGLRSLPPRCELTIAGPHTTLASFVITAQKPAWFGKHKGVPRSKVTVDTFFPVDLFDAYEDLRVAWDRLSPYLSRAPIRLATGTLFEDALLPFIAPGMLQDAQALTAALPARFAATLTTDNWPTPQSPKPFPDKLALRILGSGVPLAWVILTKLKTRRRPEYLVEIDRSFPDDAVGELAAANEAFRQLRDRGILDYSR